MSSDIKVDKEMDLKGLACPMPIVKVSKGITTDPGALTDFPAWAKTSGNEIVETVTADKETHFFIKRLV